MKMKLTLVMVLMLLTGLFGKISGLKCYTCIMDQDFAFCAKSELGDLEECGPAGEFFCGRERENGGTRVYRYCKKTYSELKLGCEEDPRFHIRDTCYCDTDGCNGSRKPISGGLAVTTLVIIILRAVI